jgi:hypothetical protein
MIERPFHFEYRLSDQELQKLGELSLTWSHTEHLIGNCLKSLLRLTNEEAKEIVFPLSLEQKTQRICKLAKLQPLHPDAAVILAELEPIMRCVQYVRNNVVHAILVLNEDGTQDFHLRSKGRTHTKAQIFESEELTNYAAHLALSLRYALGMPSDPDARYASPARPAIPKFLHELIPTHMR